MLQPMAGVKVPVTALNVPPVPVVCVQTPPVCCPVISVPKLMAVVLESQVIVLPSTPAVGWLFITTVAVAVNAGQPAVVEAKVYVII